MIGFFANPHFRPGTWDLFTIDVAGQIRIGDITRLAIEIETKGDGASWMPKAVTLSIDGRDVFAETFTVSPEVTRSLSLGFPKPL